jgi:hypothetical protein
MALKKAPRLFHNPSARRSRHFAAAFLLCKEMTIGRSEWKPSSNEALSTDASLPT